MQLVKRVIANNLTHSVCRLLLLKMLEKLVNNTDSQLIRQMIIRAQFCENLTLIILQLTFKFGETN